MINLNKFGQIIASRRLTQNMTQGQLAEILLVTPQAVSKWERGESFPDIETLVLLCYEYDISIDFLLNECFEELNLVKDICVNNVDEYLRTSHRKEVINKFLNGDLDPIKVTSIFYLLNIQERRLFVEKVISGDLDIDLAEFIIILNPAERMKLLDGMMDNEENMIEIRHLLSNLEKRKYTLEN
ncbi:MAG: helix-turn-helix transcriptional regulator [Melioribacteraceae bacterium]|nr:helix-turn-helix transcriptional regulator [Melioribacteraceae bacterium]